MFILRSSCDHKPYEDALGLFECNVHVSIAIIFKSPSTTIKLSLIP
jgi:hypothetical protein